VRNFIHQVGIECTFSFFYNRIYSLHVQDYKRKFFVYKKSKLYFLRGKINSNTKVI
jgi:ribosomal protein L19